MPIKKRNYIIEWTDGFFTERNSEITFDLCAMLAKRRLKGKDWENSPVSKQHACRHCRGTGVIHLEGTPVIKSIEPALNKRGNIRLNKDGTVKTGPIKEAKVKWSEACICVKKCVERMEKLDANAIIMGEFHD